MDYTTIGYMAVGFMTIDYMNVLSYVRIVA